MNYRKNMFAILLAGAFLSACGGGGTDISGGASSSSGSGSGSSGSGSGSSGSGTTTTAYTLSVETCSNSTATACNTITELSLQNTNYVVSRLVDASGQPVSGKVITLTTNRGTIKPSSGKLTDSNGYAVFSLTSDNLSDAGELSNITATNTNATSVTNPVSYADNANLAFTFSVDTSSLDSLGRLNQGSTAVLNFAVTLNNQPYKTPVTINLSSPCNMAGKAVLPSSVTTDSSGQALASYKGSGDNGVCLTNDTITAKLSSENQLSQIISNYPAPSSTIIASTPSPEFIALKGYNSSNSDVKFTLKNSMGTPVAGKQVDFSFALPAMANSAGYKLEQSYATTDDNGTVTATVNAGTIPVPVAVIATLHENTNIHTASLPIAVGTGYPDSDSFSFSADVYSIEGQNYDGSKAIITMRLADRFNNPIPDGTKVYFTTEGGSIKGDLTDASAGSTPDCITKDSTCTATLTSMNPRPKDGRITVLVYTEGEESFEDQNGNGILDADDYVGGELLFDDPMSTTYVNGSGHGDSEPYLDTNNTGAYASGKSFVDLNKDATWNNYDGVYHGLACDNVLVADGTCDRHTIQLYTNHEFILSSIQNNSGFFVEQWNGSKWVKATSPLDVSVVGYYRFLPVNIATDGKTYNPLPSGAKISVSTTNGGDISNGMPGAFIPGTPAQESDTYNAYINNYPSIHPGDKTGPIDLSISTDISGSTDVGATRPYYFYFIVKPEDKPNNKTTGTLTISATTGAGSSTGAGGAIKVSFDANDNG